MAINHQYLNVCSIDCSIVNLINSTIIMNEKLFKAISESKNTLAQTMSESLQTDIQSIKNSENSTVLHIAANNRNHIMLQYFLNLYDNLILKNPVKYTIQKKKKWINQKDNEGFSAIHYSVFQNSKKMAFLLEKHGADIHSTNEMGLNLLHIAAQTDAVALLHYYLEKGLDIKSKDRKGSTPLHWACYSGQQITTSALIAWKSQINIQQNEYGMTPLHLAVLSANGRVVKKLLLKGADRNIRDKAGFLALDLARQHKYQTITEMLIDRQGIQQLLNLKTPFRKSGKITSSFIFFMVNYFLVFMFNLNVIFPLNSQYNSDFNLTFVVLGSLCLIILFSLIYRGPGYLKNHERSNMSQILDKVSPQKICFDCQIVKPQRSRHCEICKSCILVFDHHCPWVANCIGARNYFLFYCFLFFMVTYLAFIIIFEIKSVLSVYLQQDSQIQINFLQWTIAIYTFVISGLFLIPLMLLIIFHTKNCLEQKTTYENFNQKHKNNSDDLTQPFLQSQAERISQTNGKQNSDRQHSFSMDIQSSPRQQNSYSSFFFVKWIQNCQKMCFTNMKNQTYWGSSNQY